MKLHCILFGCLSVVVNRVRLQLFCACMYAAHACSFNYKSDYSVGSRWCFIRSWNVHPAWCLNETRLKNICRDNKMKHKSFGLRDLVKCLYSLWVYKIWAGLNCVWLYQYQGDVSQLFFSWIQLFRNQEISCHSFWNCGLIMLYYSINIYQNKGKSVK